MPYYLNNASSNTARVEIPSVTIGGAVGDYIEIKAVANSGNTGGRYALCGTRTDWTNFIFLQPTATGIEFKSGSSTSGSGVFIKSGYTQPPVGSVFTVRFTRVTSTNWQANLDGVNLGSPFTSAGNLTINNLFSTNSSGGSQSFLGGIYYVAISTNGGASATRYYDPSNTSTGTTLIDAINSANNGNQAGTWPTDNSEWVFYSSGASNTVTVSATLPKITGSLTLNEINPSYVISVNGQLPKITGAVALNEINPVFIVAVAGQLPKLTGSIALNQFANNRQVTVSGVLPKLTGDVTLNRIQPNNQAAVSGQLPKITASITLRVPDSYPTANPNDYTVAAYLSTDSTYTARLSESSTINAIISASSTFNARLN